MATTREQFIALRKSGMTPVQAREEVMKTVTPVSPTTNANVAQLEANRARVQSQIASGERPAVGTSVTPQAEQTQAPTPTTPPPAPIAPTTTPSGATMTADGTVTPAQSEQSINSQLGGVIQPNGINSIQPLNAKTTMPAEPAKQLKAEPVVDYTQAQGREQDIIKNLDTFKAQNMTPEQIMRASDYQNATPEKKALIDPYLKQQVPTASAMYNAIATKADIPDDQKTTLPFKIAQNRYTKANSFSTMTASQLANEMDNSRFIQGSQAYEDVKAMNPKLVQDTENLRIVNGKKQNIFTYVNNPDGTSTKVNNLEKTFAEDYMDNFGDTIKKMFAVQTPEQIRALIYTDDVKQAQDKASEIELTMNELEKQMDNVDDDVDKELAGSGATGSRIALEKASRKDKLGKEYNSKLKNYTTYANKANNLITQNTTVYQTQQQQQQAQNAAMLPFLTDQYKTEQEKLKAEAALNDPATQIKSTMDEFAKMGIVAQGDLTSKIAEYKASGKTLPEYISGLRQQFMSKPEYKKIQELQQGQLSDAQKIAVSQNFDLKKMGLEQSFQMKLAQAKETTNNKWTKLDDGLYTNEAGDIITGDELKTAKLANNSYITKPVGAEGGECGFYASRATGMSSTPGGNSKEARIQAFSDKTPEIGGMAFFGGPGYDKTYGHIGIVTGVNQENGTVTIKDSNYGNDLKVRERTVPASSITGYYNNTPLAQGINTQQQPAGQYSEADIELFSEIAAMDGSVQNTALKNSNLTRQKLAEYTSLAKAGKIPPTESQKQAALGTMSNIQGIAGLDWTDAVGKFDYSRMLGLQDSENAKALIDNIRNSSALNNLGMLKGPMSDKDVEFIKSVSSKLDPVQSNTQFEKNIVEMYNIAARKVGADEIKNLSEIPKERILPGQQQATNTGTVNTGGGQTQEYKGYVIRGMN